MINLTPTNVDLLPRVARTLMALGVVAVLAACSALPDKPAPVVRYDFGLPAPVTTTGAPAAVGTPLVMAKFKATGAIDANTAIYYRLAYANDRERHPYTQARWSASSTQLIQQRVRDALSQRRAVLMDDDGATQALVPAALPAMLRVEVDEFSQVFDSTATSRGVLRMRATLTELTPRGEKWLGQQVIDVSEPASSADVAGGAAAMATATTRAAQQIDQWLRQQGR